MNSSSRSTLCGNAAGSCPDRVLTGVGKEPRRPPYFALGGSGTRKMRSSPRVRSVGRTSLAMTAVVHFVFADAPQDALPRRDFWDARRLN